MQLIPFAAAAAAAAGAAAGAAAAVGAAAAAAAAAALAELKLKVLSCEVIAGRPGVRSCSSSVQSHFHYFIGKRTLRNSE